jgi:hypothetical protein
MARRCRLKSNDFCGRGGQSLAPVRTIRLIRTIRTIRIGALVLDACPTEAGANHPHPPIFGRRT